MVIIYYAHLVCNSSIVLQNVVVFAPGCLFFDISEILIVSKEERVGHTCKAKVVSSRKRIFTFITARAMRGSATPRAAAVLSGTWSRVVYL